MGVRTVTFGYRTASGGEFAISEGPPGLSAPLDMRGMRSRGTPGSDQALNLPPAKAGGVLREPPPPLPGSRHTLAGALQHPGPRLELSPLPRGPAPTPGRCPEGGRLPPPIRRFSGPAPRRPQERFRT